MGSFIVEIVSVSASDVAQDAQTTAGTLSLPSARNGSIKRHRNTWCLSKYAS